MMMIRAQLPTEQGAVVVKALRQGVGENIVTLADKRSVARIGAGQIFTAAATTINVGAQVGITGLDALGLDLTRSFLPDAEELISELRRFPLERGPTGKNSSGGCLLRLWPVR